MRKLIALCGLGLLLAGCQVPGSNEATPEDTMLPPAAEMPAPEAAPVAPEATPAAEMPATTETPAAATEVPAAE